MQVIVALENVIKTFTFPDDAQIYPHCSMSGYLEVRPLNGQPHWFNPTYVIAIVPGTRMGS